MAFVKAPSDLGGHAKDGTLDAANKTYDFAKRIAKDVDDVIHFRPKVTQSGTTVVEASKSIAELSTVSKQFEHTFPFEAVWMGSTKRLKIKGDFVAKAGYDLTKPFSIDVSEDHTTIRAIMPPAKLNSVEQTKYYILEDSNGLWNKITSDDRQNALNRLLADAKKSLDSTSLLADADAALMSQLEKAVRKSSNTTTIVREPLQ